MFDSAINWKSCENDIWGHLILHKGQKNGIVSSIEVVRSPLPEDTKLERATRVRVVSDVVRG